MMALTNPTLVLTDARTRGLSWRSIVEALRDITSNGSLDPENRPWIEIAASLTGYTVVQLRQAQRTYTAIESLIETQDLPLHGLDWPMSNLEVITRIAKLNPQRAEKILISSSQKSWRELLRIYETLRDEPGSRMSAMSAGHSSARTFTTMLSDVLSGEQGLQDLLGDECVITHPRFVPWHGRYLFAHPDFVTGYYRADAFCLAAFEGLRFYGEISNQAAANAASKAAVEATFFNRYYWCLSTSLPAANLINMRNKLGLLNVGIILVEDGNAATILEPEGDPIPNRQNMLLEDALVLKRLSVGK